MLTFPISLKQTPTLNKCSFLKIEKIFPTDITDIILSYSLDIKIIFLFKKLILNSPKLALIAVENYKLSVKSSPSFLSKEIFKKDAVKVLKDIFNFEALRLSRLIGENNINQLKELFNLGIVPDSKHVTIVFNNLKNDKSAPNHKEALRLLETLLEGGAEIKKNHFKEIIKIPSWQVRLDFIRLFNKKGNFRFI